MTVRVAEKPRLDYAAHGAVAPDPLGATALGPAPPCDRGGGARCWYTRVPKCTFKCSIGNGGAWRLPCPRAQSSWRTATGSTSPAKASRSSGGACTAQCLPGPQLGVNTIPPGDADSGRPSLAPRGRRHRPVARDSPFPWAVRFESYRACGQSRRGLASAVGRLYHQSLVERVRLFSAPLTRAGPSASASRPARAIPGTRPISRLPTKRAD